MFESSKLYLNLKDEGKERKGKGKFWKQIDTGIDL